MLFLKQNHLRLAQWVSLAFVLLFSHHFRQQTISWETNKSISADPNDTVLITGLVMSYRSQFRAILTGWILHERTSNYSDSRRLSQA